MEKPLTLCLETRNIVLRNETHEGLLVGLDVAQTHHRWNICVIVEDLMARSKDALQS